MKLYDIPEHSVIEIEVSDGSAFVTFDHLDGLYSYCTTEKGGVIHLAAHMPLKKLPNGHYALHE